MHELVGMCMKSQNHDFLVEALGCLSSIVLPDYLYSELIIKHSFLDFLSKVCICLLDAICYDVCVLCSLSFCCAFSL